MCCGMMRRSGNDTLWDSGNTKSTLFRYRRGQILMSMVPGINVDHTKELGSHNALEALTEAEAEALIWIAGN